MKSIIYAICIGSLALAGTAWGEEIKTNGKSKGSTSSAAVKGGGSARSYGHASSNVSRVNTGRSFSTAARIHQPTYNTNRSAMVRQHTSTNLSSNTSMSVRNRNFSTSNNLRTRNYVTTNRNRTLSAGAGSNATVNRSRNFGVNNGGNVTTRRSNFAVNNNWRGQQFSGQNYSAFRNYSRSYHDRSWYRSHYPRISFYFGAPYYWDSGYWYPAWGYYPDYAYDDSYYDNGSCYVVQQRVHTSRGWRVRPVQVCS